MGSSSVARRVAAPTVEDVEAEPESASTGADSSLKSVKDVLSALSAWIPSEALGLYTLVYGTLLPKRNDEQVPVADAGTVESGTADLPIGVPSVSNQWQLFWIVLGLSAVFLVLQSESARRQNAKPAGKKLRESWKVAYFGRLFLSIVLSAVALALYIANVPGNPFVQPFGFIDATWAPGYAAIAAILIPVVAGAAGIQKPSSD